MTKHWMILAITILAAMSFVSAKPLADFEMKGLYYSPEIDAPVSWNGEWEGILNPVIINLGDNVSGGFLEAKIRAFDTSGKKIDFCETTLEYDDFPSYSTENPHEKTTTGKCLMDLAEGLYVLNFTLDFNSMAEDPNKANNEFSTKFEVLSRRFKCADSDSGKDEYSKGSAYGFNPHSLILENMKDECLNSTTLMEYSCMKFNGTYNNQIESSEIGCQNGCFEGICMFKQIHSISATGDAVRRPMDETLCNLDGQCMIPAEPGIFRRMLAWIGSLF